MIFFFVCSTYWFLIVHLQGMVEKWLSQVEQLMVQSVKDSCMMAVHDYFRSPRSEWLLKWPGQVVICGTCIRWTAEVCEAIENRRLSVSKVQFRTCPCGT
jgi:hypothetical protein